MDKQTELAIVRRAYAKQVLANASIDEPRLEAPYAEVSREHFLGPCPWAIFAGRRDMCTDDDPVYLYTNDVIGIDPVRGIKAPRSGCPTVGLIRFATGSGHVIVSKSPAAECRSGRQGLSGPAAPNCD
jgi:protein-L-isoaspartate(D-aspartate) O-methyltransferase